VLHEQRFIFLQHIAHPLARLEPAAVHADVQVLQAHLPVPSRIVVVVLDEFFNEPIEVLILHFARQVQRPRVLDLGGGGGLGLLGGGLLPLPALG